MSGGPRTETDVVNEFQARRQRLSEAYSKMNELASEIGEHDVVTKALEPMDGTRKCFRLIGEVLVERTVGEVLPAVQKNRENLDGLVQTLTESIKQQETELNAFQVRMHACVRIGDAQIKGAI